MNNVSRTLTQWIRTQSLWKDLITHSGDFASALRTSTKVTACANHAFGHYQWSAVPQLAKLQKIPPREIAQSIVASIQPHSMMEEISAAPNGMINMKLKQDWIFGCIEDIIRKGKVDIEKSEFNLDGKDANVLVDYSSPNIAKSMHVGHLRSTILGHTISNVLEFAGYKVERVSHIGDWGTNLGMVIAQLILNHQENGEKYTDLSVKELETIYKSAKKRFDEDSDFQKLALQAVVRLQSGSDQLVKDIWENISSITKRENQMIYDLLGIHGLVERGESFYQQFIPTMVQDLKARGIITESDGADVIFVDGFSVPMILTKSEGGSTYDTTDLAALWYRIVHKKFDWVIYVVDKGQSEHLQRLFGASKRCSWIESDAKSSPKLNHVEFGLVLGNDGKKFKTRSGDAVPLISLLDEAVSRCHASMVERGRHEILNSEQMKLVASSIGYNAVKYADLKQSRIKNYIYSADRLTDLKGNTALYLMYTFARVISIMKKVELYQSSGVFVSEADIQLMSKNAIQRRPSSFETKPISLDKSELSLLVGLLKFPEVIDGVLSDLQPHHLCDYAYEIACLFNDFHRDCRVSDVEDESLRYQRIVICASSSMILHKSMTLLGFERIPEVV